MTAAQPLTLTLNDGKTIPQLGFGTCRIAPETTARMVSNFAAQFIELTEAEVAALDALDRNHRLGGDPAEGDLGAPAYSDRRSWQG